MKKNNVILYECECCGFSSADKSAVERCESLGKEYKSLQDLVPWKWYILRHKKEYFQIKSVFVSDIKFNFNYHSIRCTGSSIRLEDFEYNQYFDIMQDWDIDEILSLEEGYSTHKLIPQSAYFKNVPEEVCHRINKVINDSKFDRIQELKNMSKDELVQLVIKEDEVSNYKKILN